MTVCFLLKFIGDFCLLRFVFLLCHCYSTAWWFVLVFLFSQHINSGFQNSLYERLVLFGYQFLVNFPNNLNCVWQHGETLFICTLLRHSLSFISLVLKKCVRYRHYCCCLGLRVTNKERKFLSWNGLYFQQIWENNQTLRTWCLSVLCYMIVWCVQNVDSVWYTANEANEDSFLHLQTQMSFLILCS